MGNIDRDAAFFFFGSIINGIESAEFSKALFGQIFGNGGRQCRLAVIHVTDGSYI